jgi:hypothetical protein
MQKMPPFVDAAHKRCPSMPEVQERVLEQGEGTVTL